MKIETSDVVELASIIAAGLSEQLQKNFQIIPTMTLADAAKAVGVSDETMRKLCTEGKIPYIKMDRLYRLRPADVNRYLEQNYHTPHH